MFLSTPQHHRCYNNNNYSNNKNNHRQRCHCHYYLQSLLYYKESTFFTVATSCCTTQRWLLNVDHRLLLNVDFPWPRTSCHRLLMSSSTTLLLEQLTLPGQSTLGKLLFPMAIPLVIRETLVILWDTETEQPCQQTGCATCLTTLLNFIPTINEISFLFDFTWMTHGYSFPVDCHEHSS